MLMEEVYKSDATSELLLKNHEQFAVQIGISAQTFHVSIKLWRAVYDLNPELESDATQWFAAIVLVSVLNCRVNSDDRLKVNVTTLLKKSSMSVLSLLTKLKHLREIVYLSQRSIDGILDFQRRFCVTAAIYDRFSHVYADVFIVDNRPINDDLDPNYVYDIPESKQACWLLFLLAKDEIPIAHTEMFLSFQVLLCAVDFVMRATPKFLLQPVFETALEKEAQTIEALAEITPVLKMLCNKYGCDTSEMVHVKKKLDATFFVSFSQKPVNSEKKIDSVFPGGDSVLPNSSELHGRYWEVLDRYFELDETLFLAEDPIVLLQGSVGSSNYSENSLNREQHQLGLDHSELSSESVKNASVMTHSMKNESQVKVDEIFSKFEEALTTLLHEIIAQSENYFTECTIDEIKSNSKRTLTQVVLKLADSSNNGDESSETTNDGSNISPERLECLLAISSMATLANYFSLPPENQETQIDDNNAMSVLKMFNIPFVKFICEIDKIEAAGCLFSVQVSRLKFLEERILETHLYSDDSFVQTFMQWKNLESQSSAKSINQLQLSSDEISTVSNKICRLAYKRVQQLCKLLSVPSELEVKIWECLEHCIFERTFLFQNRHLDQILMCSIYAICKVSDQERKFKSITQAYRKMPSTAAEVFKKAKIFDEDNSFDSIIAFYNKVFMQTLKTFILQFSKPTSNEDTSEKQTSVANVLKRVNPNVLARNALNKPAVHQPPAIATCTSKAIQIANTGPKYWPSATGGLPSDTTLPLRHMASAIVANRSYQHTTKKWARMFPGRKTEPSTHLQGSKVVASGEQPPPPKVQFLSSDTRAKKVPNRGEESSESSEDEEEARANQDIYNRIINSGLRFGK